MTDLMNRYTRDLNLKGYSPRTCNSYTYQIVQFLRHTENPKLVTSEDIKNYLYHLVTEHKVSDSTIRQAYSAIRYLYAQTLGFPWENLNIPQKKKKQKLPRYYTRQEVNAILDNTRNLKHKAILTLTYSSGLRLSEAVNLKLSDIKRDKKRLLIRQGKGAKDRYTILSERVLVLLEEYWRAYQPKIWLFPGRNNKPLSPRSCQSAFYLAKEKAGLPKEGGIHGLRHSFATHYLESGGGIFQLQKFLGHKNLKTTLIYAHVQEENISAISPWDYYENR